MTNLIYNVHYTVGRTNISIDDLNIVYHYIFYNIRVFPELKLAKYKQTNLAILNCQTMVVFEMLYWKA